MKAEPVEKGPLGFLAGLRVGKFLGAFGQADEIGDGFRRFLFKQRQTMFPCEVSRMA